MSDVTVAISGDFMEAFSEVPRGKQKKVRQFMTKFRQDPTRPGINYEKIEGAKDDKLRSARIDQQYRGIVLNPDQDNVYTLLWVDKHDDAYQWARNRFVQIHPETGSLQVLPIEEGKGPLPNAEEVKGGNDESGGEGEDEEDLFSEHRDRELVRLGVPEAMLPMVREIRTEEQLDQAQPYFPDEAYEALFLLAAGYDQREVDNELAYRDQEVDTDDYQAALERPNSQRRFTVVGDEEELEQILEAPLEMWRVFLHPSQRRLVEIDANGPVRVLGGAGTGKTVVAMHRAVWLAENFFTEEEDRLLFTTFTKNLAADIEKNLRLIGSEEALSRIEVRNLDSWVSQFLRDQGHEYSVDYGGGQTEGLWEEALAVAPEDQSPEFLRNEWEQVIQPNGIEKEAAYMRISRVGRGTPLQRPVRKKIWPVFEEYQRLLDEHQLRERSGALRDARQILEEEGDILPYQSVLVDEAQDMGKQAFKLIRQMIPGGDQKNDIFIVGDAHQRIYEREVVLGHCGINIVGRGYKLHVNYRTTEENRRWAVGLLEGAEYDDLDGGTDEQEVYKSLIRGENPQVQPFDTFQEEAEAITAHLSESDEDLRDVCLIARTKSLLDNYRGALRAEDLDTHVLRSNEPDDRSKPGVRLATMHRAKGLEFEKVIVAGVTEGKVPLRQALMEADDDATRKQVLKRERSLLYVSATRAKRRVIVTCHDEPSRWIYLPE